MDIRLEEGFENFVSVPPGVQVSTGSESRQVRHYLLYQLISCFLELQFGYLCPQALGYETWRQKEGIRAKLIPEPLI